MNEEKDMRKVITIILTIMLIASTGYLLYNALLWYQHKEEAEELAALFDISEVEDELAGSTPDEGESDGAGKQKKLEKQFKKLKEINEEVKAMLIIPDTTIKYPVLQRDNAYYLEHNIYGKPDFYGSIFFDQNCQMGFDDNYIIYGHAMKDGTMFGSLRKFENQEYGKEHKEITVYTEYGKRQYLLSEVLLSKGGESLQGISEKFPWKSTDTEEQYQEFLDAAEKMSVCYRTENPLTAGKGILMLVTCEYHESDGRLVLLATEK